MNRNVPLPPPIAIDCKKANFHDLLSREWLLSNRLGAYASGSLAAANTRRYHGLLVAATAPPLGRVVTLSCLLDQFIAADATGREKAYDLATFEWADRFVPDARDCLVEFRNDLAATFVYHCGESYLVKEIALADSANVAAVRYRLIGGPPGRLRLRPFAAIRDYHELRLANRSESFHVTGNGGDLHLRNPQVRGGLRLGVGAGHAGAFHEEPQWWYRFLYRADIARGQEGMEDLFTPGWFELPLALGQAAQLTAAWDASPQMDFDAALAERRRRLESAVAGVGKAADLTTRRLAMAADSFIVRRRRPQRQPGLSILAGFHWFADWGRDAMIALPGLLLETGRHAEALEVLRTFASAAGGGMIPNYFDERGGPAAFNSIDAALWFVIAVDRYVAASGDTGVWRGELGAVVTDILRAYHDGTRFDIRAAPDGLLAGGKPDTQLTWMDVSWNGAPVTPRWGKCVEINALWIAALGIAADRCEDGALAQRPEGASLPGRFAAWADQARAGFEPAFWNDRLGCLCDCVADSARDESVRPNQILAVALPHCPLPHPRQLSVVEFVQRELLTPYGLRTLSPDDHRYRGRYGGSWESRDKAYHQGTAWAWLMGPFIEAYLKVHEFSPAARQQARKFLAAFDEHLSQAGVGFISEVFDGDRPHNPGGCIAQAWSVAELLRAKRLVEA